MSEDETELRLRAEVDAILADPRLRRALGLRPDQIVDISPGRLLLAWKALDESDRELWRRLFNLDGNGESFVKHLAAQLGVATITVTGRRDRIGHALGHWTRSGFYGLPLQVERLITGPGRIQRVDRLHEMAESKLYSIKGFGPSQLQILQDWLVANGLPPVELSQPINKPRHPLRRLGKSPE